MASPGPEPKSLALGGSRRRSVPCLLQLLVATGTPWLATVSPHVCLCGHTAFSVCVKSPSASLLQGNMCFHLDNPEYSLISEWVNQSHLQILSPTEANIYRFQELVSEISGAIISLLCMPSSFLYPSQISFQPL